MKLSADLHIHTLLSPCASLEMSPHNIIDKAVEAKLDIIGITDHNSTRQAALVAELGKERGVEVLLGAEVCSREEIHILCFFKSLEDLAEFQKIIDDNIEKIKNIPELLGDQVVVDRDQQILYTESCWLGSSLKLSFDKIAKIVAGLGGIFIPAHVDRSANGLLSTLGFIPFGVSLDAMEVSANASEKYRDEISRKYGLRVTIGSDSHYLNQIGRCRSILECNDRSFASIKAALRGV